MRTLIQSLQDHDHGYLRVVAELWGIELPAQAGAERLAAAMLEAAADLALPEPARRALEYLQRAGGRLSWEQLNRRFGPLREMGAGRRDRLKPWREPASALEMLWYRALLGRAFADSPSGPVEYGFIPSDLRPRLPPAAAVPEAPPGAPAPKPPEFDAASSAAVDDATTVLAGLRQHPSGIQPDALRRFLHQPDSLELLLELLSRLPAHPERLKSFLIEARGESLAWLQRGWRESGQWNDLARLGTLQAARSEWPNDPIAGRHAALDLLAAVPQAQWWSLDGFVAAVHERAPGFLRGPGGFDSWYLQRAEGGQFLTGFEHWEAVEGQYLRYLVAGPLHWLGGLDLSRDASSFRVGSLAGPLFGAEGAPQVEQPPGAVRVRSDGRMQVARSSDRSLRYQIARFTDWIGVDSGAYRYRLSAEALQQAEAQDLTAAIAASVLKAATDDQLPAGPARALERWSTHGLEAALVQELVLEVEDPQILERLAQHRATRRWIHDRLGPKRALVLESDWQKLSAAALGLGLLIKEPRKLRRS